MDNPNGNDQTPKNAAAKKEGESLPLLLSPPQKNQSNATSPPPIPSSTDPTLLPPNGMTSLNVDNRDIEDIDDEELERAVLDRGFGWVIVFGGFLSQVLAGGLMRCDGIYYLEFRNHFQESAQLTAWPGAISFSLQCFIAPGAAWFCNRFSVRTCIILGTIINIVGLVLTAFAPNIYVLFFSYSILQGVGRGLTLSPGIFIVNMYFDKYRGIAIGLTSAGTGIGTFTLIPLVDLAFRKLGYKDGFLVIAAIASFGFIIAAILRPLSMHKEIVRQKRLKARLINETGATKDSGNDVGNSIMSSDINPNNSQTAINSDSPTKSTKKRNWFLRCIDVIFPVEGNKNGNQSKNGPLFHWGLFEDFPFILLCTSMMFFSLALKTVLTFLPAMGEDQGLTEIQASFLLSMAGVGDTVGRITSGLVLDIPKIRPFKEVVYACVLFFAAGAALAVPFSTSFGLLCGAGIFFGMMTGASVSQRATVLASLLGKETVNSALGIMTSFLGIGTFIGPPLSGALRDISGDFKIAFFMSSGNMAGAGAFIALSISLFALRRRRQGRLGGQGYQDMDNDKTTADGNGGSLNEEGGSSRGLDESVLLNSYQA